MLSYSTRTVSAGSFSGSEPGSPQMTRSIPSAIPVNSNSSMGRRHRGSLLSFPHAPNFKKRVIRDFLVERFAPIAPSVLVIVIGLVFIFHFVLGLSPQPMDVQIFSTGHIPREMSNSEVVAEVERWRQPQYARRHLKVYYYDLPKKFNNFLVDESHRNPPKIRDPFCDENFYSAEHTIANFFKTGPVRTYNAEEADFFYIPIYSTCYLLTNLPNDVTKTGKFFSEAMDVVINDFPYWNRTDGRDHVMMFAQGFGSRLSGNWERYRNAIFLVHNGDYDEAHFDTHKDIVVPPDLTNYLTPVGISSPGEFLTKQSFVMFGGQVIDSSVSDHRGSNYSGGVRQYVQKNLAHQEGYKITGVRSATYTQDMMHSVFCLAPHGWHKWSPRPAYAILLGCIPVVISENQELFLGNLIDYTKISFWLHPDDIANMDVKLRRIGTRELLKKEKAIREVWRLLWYGEDGLAERAILYSLYRKLTVARPKRVYI